MRALDLYAGIGGWSAGLCCAGVDVVEAYEIWPPALCTYNTNLGTKHRALDIRDLDLASLPADIQLVVGSPPCTEFSLANRGGNGDIAEGLKDVVKFLEIVRHVRPTYWVMENVPRTAGLIKEGLKTEGHILFSFRDLKPEIKVLDLADFGLPQSRSRCFVGVFPFDALEKLSARSTRRTLGEVIAALGGPAEVQDPLWGIRLDQQSLTEMEPEPPLNQEQLRMNREAKCFHPVYNDMPFPDRVDRPSRTVTATCTRVSRESIVVPAESVRSVRRLTVRERATLQGFPITYQFYGISHSQKVKMIGNAVPPYFSYLVGLAVQDRAELALDFEPELPIPLTMPERLPAITPPHAVGTSYPQRRRFRAALPGLRFKSGMRFELANHHRQGHPVWTVAFFFGPSKAVRTIQLDERLYCRLSDEPMVLDALRECRRQLDSVRLLVSQRTRAALQAAWRQSAEGTGPYQLVDLLGQAAIAMTTCFAAGCELEIAGLVRRSCAGTDGSLTSEQKLLRHAPAILAGLVLGSWFNTLRWVCDGAETAEEQHAFSAG